jgi:hypothetical protein
MNTTPLTVSKHGDFSIATRAFKEGFVAWGKMGPIQGEGPLSETGRHVWFQFGETPAQAKDLLLEELGLQGSQVGG